MRRDLDEMEIKHDAQTLSSDIGEATALGVVVSGVAGDLLVGGNLGGLVRGGGEVLAEASTCKKSFESAPVSEPSRSGQQRTRVEASNARGDHDFGAESLGGTEEDESDVRINESLEKRKSRRTQQRGCKSSHRGRWGRREGRRRLLDRQHRCHRTRRRWSFQEQTIAERHCTCWWPGRWSCRTHRNRRKWR